MWLMMVLKMQFSLTIPEFSYAPDTHFMQGRHLPVNRFRTDPSFHRSSYILSHKILQTPSVTQIHRRRFVISHESYQEA